MYKLELDGRILGKFGRACQLPKKFGTVKLSLHPTSTR